jgi:S1-C subfamily serine protease
MLIHTLLVLGLAANPIGSRPLAAAVLTAPRLASAADSAPRRHTTFGVAIAPVSDAIRRMPYLQDGEGVVLTAVESGGAAEAANLRAGDLVLAVSGKRVDETTLFATLRDQPRNEAFRVEFLRDGKWHDTWATIEC